MAAPPFRKCRLSVCVSLLLAVATTAPSASASQGGTERSAFCTQVDDLRKNYGKLNRALAVKVVQDNSDPIEDWDMEEDSCINDYGVNVGFSFSGITSAILDGLKDAACSALNDAIGGQLAGLGASVTGPVGLGDLDVGFGESDSPFSIEGERKNIGVDYEDIFSDQLDKLPAVDDGFIDSDQSGGRSPESFEYLGTGDSSDVDVPSVNGDRR